MKLAVTVAKTRNLQKGQWDCALFTTECIQKYVDVLLAPVNMNYSSQ